jgi:hypothetical protein
MPGSVLLSQLLAPYRIIFGVCFVTVAVGCAEFPGPRADKPSDVGFGSGAMPNAANAEFAKCQSSVRFSGQPRPHPDPGLAGAFANAPHLRVAKWDAEDLIYEQYRLIQEGACVCNDTLPFDKISLKEMSGNFPSAAVKKLATLTGSRATFELDMPAPETRFRRRIIMSFPTIDHKCVMMAGVAYLDEVPPEGHSFLATLRHGLQRGNESTESWPASGSSAPAVARLTELKDLLDRGLITKAEYEQKRKAILDGL